MKKRILNERLAAIVASIRHSEMLFIADAGSGTSMKSHIFQTITSYVTAAKL